MDSCSSGPGIKHSPRLTEFALDCIGFITIPNASENFPVGPVFTTGFTPRRRTTILASVTSVYKPSYRGKNTPCTLNL